MRDNRKIFKRYAPWLLLLLCVDLLAALFLWMADIEAFYAVLAALVLSSLFLFLIIYMSVVRHEQKKAQAFERFVSNPDEFGEEALLKLCSEAEREGILLLARVLWEKEDTVNQLHTRVLDYEEYVESWAHETKMPLSLLTMLLDNRGDEISEGVSFKLDYIRNRMQEYINQMLFYARLKGVRKDYLFDQINVRACLDEVLDDFCPLLEEKSFDIIIRLSDVTVFTDKRGLVFVLSQLVSNAVKYCSPDSKPQLIIEMTQTRESNILSLRDNGMGVRSCDLPYIFERGFTGDSGDGRKRATGMGLYLAKGVADDLNISLTAQSEWGKGFEMRIEFPVVH